jgi:hypothetical protein
MTMDNGGVHAASGDAGSGPGAGGDGWLRPWGADGGAAGMLLPSQGRVRLQRGHGSVLRRDAQPFVRLQLGALGIALVVALVIAGCGEGDAGSNGTGGAGAAMAGTGGAPSSGSGGAQGTGGATGSGGAGSGGASGSGGAPVTSRSCASLGWMPANATPCRRPIDLDRFLTGYRGDRPCASCYNPDRPTAITECTWTGGADLCVASCDSCEFR